MADGQILSLFVDGVNIDDELVDLLLVEAVLAAEQSLGMCDVGCAAQPAQLCLQYVDLLAAQTHQGLLGFYGLLEGDAALAAGSRDLRNFSGSRFRTSGSRV